MLKGNKIVTAVVDCDNLVIIEPIIALRQVTKHSKFTSRTIAWYTNSDVYHSEIVINNSWISSNVAGKGVHVKPLKPYRGDYKYIILPKVKLTLEQFNNFKNWLNEQLEKGYDFTGIMFSQAIPLRHDNQNKWFCSELVTKILQLLGYYEVIDLLPHLVSPGMLEDIFKKYLINGKPEHIMERPRN